MHGAKLPVCFTKTLSERHVDEARAWWSALAEDERRTLLALVAAPRDRIAVLRWNDTEPLDAIEQEEMDSLAEHFAAQGLSFPPVRTFHICTAHPAARAALAQRKISAAFECPLARAECPMRALADASSGRDLHVEVR